jgi:hypothetical protein
MRDPMSTFDPVLEQRDNSGDQYYDPTSRTAADPTQIPNLSPNIEKDASTASNGNRQIERPLV